MLWHWFYLLYADKGILDAVASYLDATEVGYMLSSFTKTVGMGPAFDTAQQNGTLDADWLRTARYRAYYEPVKALGESDLNVDGHNYKMLKSFQPALMGIQEQMTRRYGYQYGFGARCGESLWPPISSNAGGNAGLLLSLQENSPCRPSMPQKRATGSCCRKTFACVACWLSLVNISSSSAHANALGHALQHQERDLKRRGYSPVARACAATRCKT